MPTPTREELLKSYDDLSAFVADQTTPEAIAEGEKSGNELREAIAKLNGAFIELEGVLRDRGTGFAQVPFWVPNRRGRGFRLCFVTWDGEKLVGAPNGEKPVPVRSLSIGHRIALVEELRFLV